MRCPFCRTENRDERDTCYNCEKDLSTLRLVLNKARSHFNLALEHAERGRPLEAIAELNHALDLDESHINSHIVLGTLYAQAKRPDMAREQWKQALSIDPRLEKAHLYINKLDAQQAASPKLTRRLLLIAPWSVVVIILLLFLSSLRTDPSLLLFERALEAYRNNNHATVIEMIHSPQAPPDETSRFHHSLLELGQLILERETLLLETAQQRFDDARALGDSDRLALSRSTLQPLFQGRPSPNAARRAHALLTEIDQFAPRLIVISAAAALDQNDWPAADAHLERLPPTPPLPQDLQTKTFEIRTQIYQFARDDIIRALDAFQTDAPATNTTPVQTALERLSDLDARHDDLDAADFLKSAQSALDIIIGQKNEAAKKTEPPPAPLLQDTITSITLKENEKLALKRWIWMIERDGAYEEARVSKQDAQTTIDQYPQVARHLSRREYPTSQDNLAFYYAISLLRVGRQAEAHQTFERILREFPDDKSTIKLVRRHYKPQPPPDPEE